MKTTKFTEAQIIFALRQADTGVPVSEVCRKMGVSEATYYNWNRGGEPQEVCWFRCAGTT
uniref:transposase n=1 Tax=Dyadobacter flavalbus TaxID=2579942 RepID=UPI00191BF46D